MDRRGFTLVELIIGMVLAAIVGVAIYQALVNSQRVYQMQTERAAMNSNTRTAIALLPMELREMSATDDVESDVVRAEPGYVEYKAMRGLFFVCSTPSATSVTVWSADSLAFGLRTTVTAGQDGIVVFSEGSPGSRGDNDWIHAEVTAVATGTACPGGQPSMTLTISSVDPSGGMSGVRVGAPLRTYEQLKVGTYSAGGSTWLGAQVHDGSAYGGIQPVLGPLKDGDGLVLTYFDSTGATTTDEADVVRIGLRIVGQTSRPVYNAGDLRAVVDTLITSVALRNNRR
jgi:prepilin-type N-terminal cleavage/methylation domain-containing protein